MIASLFPEAPAASAASTFWKKVLLFSNALLVVVFFLANGLAAFSPAGFLANGFVAAGTNK